MHVYTLHCNAMQCMDPLLLLILMNHYIDNPAESEFKVPCPKAPRVKLILGNMYITIST